MDRRDSLKSMLIGGITGGLLLSGCNPSASETSTEEDLTHGMYGRTDSEHARDARLQAGTFFTEQEASAIAVLCDLILPANTSAGSATDAGVTEFIEFIVKDITEHQVPMRGGLMWLDNRCFKIFAQDFNSCSDTQRREILDTIAYPDHATPETEQGVTFFSRMRNLVLTGYYTSEMGIKDLGYQGNTPNIWDGVPESVLSKHGLAYEEEWLKKCIDQETRNEIAVWDEAGNLVN